MQFSLDSGTKKMATTQDRMNCVMFQLFWIRQKLISEILFLKVYFTCLTWLHHSPSPYTALIINESVKQEPLSAPDSWNTDSMNLVLGYKPVLVSIDELYIILHFMA